MKDITPHIEQFLKDGDLKKAMKKTGKSRPTIYRLALLMKQGEKIYKGRQRVYGV